MTFIKSVTGLPLESRKAQTSDQNPDLSVNRAFITKAKGRFPG